MERAKAIHRISDAIIGVSLGALLAGLVVLAAFIGLIYCFGGADFAILK